MTDRQQDTYTVPKFPSNSKDATLGDWIPPQSEVAKLRDERAELVAALRDVLSAVDRDHEGALGVDSAASMNRATTLLARLGSAA